MSVDARPNLLRVIAERRALWLVVPAVALLAGLVLIGSWAVTPPPVVAQAEPTVPATPAIAVAAAATAAITKPDAQGAFSPEQKQEIEKIIKTYLVANPEIFLEAQTALEAKMEKDQAEK